MVGLALLLVIGRAGTARAQGAARLAVEARVVSMEPARIALASARWLSRRPAGSRVERGLATIVVSRERKRVAINYLRN